MFTENRRVKALPKEDPIPCIVCKKDCNGTVHRCIACHELVHGFCLDEDKRTCLVHRKDGNVADAVKSSEVELEKDDIVADAVKSSEVELEKDDIVADAVKSSEVELEKDDIVADAVKSLDGVSSPVIIRNTFTYNSGRLGFEQVASNTRYCLSIEGESSTMIVSCILRKTPKLPPNDDTVSSPLSYARFFDFFFEVPISEENSKDKQRNYYRLQTGDFIPALGQCFLYVDVILDSCGKVCIVPHFVSEVKQINCKLNY
jgi:hypothetical protein